MAQPRTLRDPDRAQALLAAVGADAMIVAAYGLILPPEVLAIPRLGCINIHASLLPRWRGAAPIQRAIEAGDTETGITIMQMDAGLDTGPMLLERALPIGPDDTGGQVHDRLAALGATMIVEALDGIATGRIRPVPQPDDGATYAAKIGKTDAVLDWTLSAAKLAAKIRAFDPFPGRNGAACRACRDVEDLERARRCRRTHRLRCTCRSNCRVGLSGRGGGLRREHTGSVCCGGGSRLRLLELQKPGGRRMEVAEFLRGYPVPVGARFELSAPGG